jgi:hypothetical protein
MLQNSTNIKEKSRHGCLTAYLVVLIVGNAISLIVYLLGGLAPANDRPAWLLAFYSVIAGFDIVCAIAIFMWKKWGVYGLCGVTFAGLVISIIQGELLIISLINLIISLGLLFWVLNIGGENKSWPQLE